MNVQELAVIALDHWKRYPETYQAMKKAGQLQKEAEAAARLTLAEMETLMYRGAMTEHDAWEASRNIFILTDPSKNWSLEEEDEEPNPLSRTQQDNLELPLELEPTPETTA